MNEQKQEYNLIEHMLSLLNLLQTNNIEVEQLLEGKVEGLQGLSDPNEVKTVCEVIRFMDEIPGGFLIYYAGDDERIIYANKGLLRIFQCDTLEEFRELTGNSFRGMVHPEDLDEVEKSIRKQIKGRHSNLDYVEYRVIRKDGEIRWIEDYGHFIHSETIGDIFYVFLGDTTERWTRRLEEKEIFQQEQLRRLRIIEGLSINYDSILYADLDVDEVLPYRLSTRTGPLFERIFQARKFSEYAKEYVNTWVYPEEREKVSKMTEPSFIQERLMENRTYYINYRVIEDGKLEYMQLRIVKVSEGTRTQIVIGYRKVDEEQRQELEQKKMLAEALNNANLAIDAKNSFLSNVSHDMRTPLNAIFGFIALAKKNMQDSDTVKEYLERIETSGKRLLDLIDKVLEISWTESSEVYTEEMECDVCVLFQEIYDLLHPLAQEKEIDFQLDLSGILHKQIYSDYDKLKQALLYLANNAVTYTKPGGKVSITATEQVGTLNHYATYQFEVKDTGIGISEEFLERIFEPFVREKNTTLSGIHGVGLGLTIAKNLIDMMGGKITAQSVVGKGSTFTVTLRFRIPDSETTMVASHTEIEGGAVELSGKRILLVEDNELNLEIETALLNEMGFYVETAEDGQIAVDRMKRAKHGEFDVILMDIQMPVMDGWEAARQIRMLEDPVLANTPIIAFSANVFERDIRKSMESGMNAHLTKPINIPLLMKAIEDILQKEK